MRVKTRINQAELFFIVTQSIVGISILSLPYHTYQSAAQDGWISVLISGFAVSFFVLLIWLLCKRFPQLTLFDFSKIILGKTLGNIINFFYIMYLLLMVSYIFIMIDDIFVRWIFPETPRVVLLLAGMIVLIYGCIGKLKSMVYLFSFLFLFILFLIIITLFTFINSNFDIRYLFPMASNGLSPILKGTIDAFPAYTGYETLLVYFAFIHQPKKGASMKGSVFAIIFVTFLYTYIMLQATIFYSPAELKIILEPVIYMLRAVNMHLLQRFDLIFLSIWGIVVTASIISYSYLGSMGISKLLRMKHNVAVILASIVVFSLSIVCHTNLQQIDLSAWILRLNMIFGILIPVILLILAIILKRKAPITNEEK